MVVLVMGVSGSGKSTFGARLADALGADFLEGDDFHASESIRRMQQGIPLDDDDRLPWLKSLNAELRAREESGRAVVLACSALKARYRELLSEGLAAPLRLIQLHGDPKLLAARLASRQGHFMPATLLASQLAALEPASGPDVLHVDIAWPLEHALARVLAAWQAPWSGKFAGGEAPAVMELPLPMVPMGECFDAEPANLAGSLENLIDHALPLVSAHTMSTSETPSAKPSDTASATLAVTPQATPRQPGPAPYPIGTPGVPWGPAERSLWLSRQQIQRSYADDVLAVLERDLPAHAERIDYGMLDYRHLGLGRYPLVAVRSRDWHADRPVVLVTGGVHGYETSGVHGALAWIREDFAHHADALNLLVLPCISPWGYETINRWNPEALDPNRQFHPSSPAGEAALAMACIAAHTAQVHLHVDLHETTDTDNSEFGPAKAARDGKPFDWHAIPDGFYLVGDTERPEPDFQAALIDAVRKVTHIAEPDADGRLIGTLLKQPGVIHYPKRSLGLCGGVTDARFVTTTEVYPDSPQATPAQCIAAQRATVNAGIAYLRAAS